MRSHLCEHFWGSQQYAWLDTGAGSGWYEESLLQLQPAHQLQPSQPERVVHSHAVLEHIYLLCREQFKDRLVHSRTIAATSFMPRAFYSVPRSGRTRNIWRWLQTATNS